MPRAEVEQNLLRRHPHLPAGVVVAAVGWTARRLLRRRAGRREVSWAEVEQAADEQLLLRAALRPVTPEALRRGDACARDLSSR